MTVPQARSAQPPTNAANGASTHAPARASDDLAALLDAVALPDRPGDPAFLDASGRTILLRGAFGTRVRAAAAAYERAGLGPGDAVAFGVRQDAGGVAWLLGAFRAGLQVVVLDPGVTPGRTVAQARAAGVRAAVLDGGIAAIAGSGLLRTIAARRGVHLPATADLAPRTWVTGRTLGGARRLDRLASPGDDARHELERGAAALALFTSGTTGWPRAVVHTAGSLAATMTQALDLVPLAAGDRVLGSGLHLVAPALLAGAAVVVPDSRARGDAAALARTTLRAGVTHASMPLHTALAWAGSGGAGPDLRRLLLGSAPVRAAGLTRLTGLVPSATRVDSVYGMTEHLLVATVDAAERRAHDERTGDLVGLPLPGVTVRVAADMELHVSGPAAARSYLGDPAPRPEMPSGDLARLDARGRIVLLGRVKDMLIRDGANIYPALYEEPLAAAAGLDAAVLVGVEAPDGDERVVLVVVPAADEAGPEVRRRIERLLRSAESPLDAHVRPDAILVVPVLPRAGRSGKPDRPALRALARTHLADGLDAG